MREEIEGALAALAGAPLTEAGRDADQLTLVLGGHTLHVACAWRVRERGEILVASGDLYTPADPEADLESFDWEEPEATLWDLRWRSLLDAFAPASPLVERATADAFGGFTLAFAGGLALDLFPNSSAAPHVETEFWRLVSPGGEHVAVGTFGVERGDR